MKTYKKILGLLVVFISIFALNLNVKAQTLTYEDGTSIDVHDYIGNITTFTKSYDSTNKVNVLNVKITLNQESIDTILAHKAGNSNSQAAAGVLYYEIKPTFSTVSSQYKKNYKTVNGNFAQAKQELDSSLGSESEENYTAVYDIDCIVKYNQEGSFNVLSELVNGNKSIGDSLVEKITEKTRVDELTYGTDYIIYMTEGQTLWGWELADGTKEYLLVNAEVEFPITGVKDGDSEQYYFPTLDDALKANANVFDEIIVNSGTEEIKENTSISKKIVVKSGATVKISSNISGVNPNNFVLEPGANLVIEGSGKLTNPEGNELHIVNFASMSNGSITANSVLAAKGATITLTVNPASGYRLKTGSLKVKTKTSSSDVNLSGYTFEMPDEDVEVSAEFEKIPKSSNQVHYTVAINKTEEEKTDNFGKTLRDLYEEIKASGVSSIKGFTDEKGNKLNLDTLITNGSYYIAILSDNELSPNETPQTLDTILSFVGLGIVSIGAIGIVSKKYVLLRK